MSETSINSNQLRGDGIKILNVVQTGTLTRDGAVFSGFSTSKYLELGARFDKGILSVDSPSCKKDFGSIVETADSWEILFKIKTPIASNTEQGIFINNANWASALWFNTVNLTLSLSNSGSQVDIGTISINAETYSNTAIYVQAKFDGTKYYLTILDENKDVLATDSLTSNTKLINRDVDWLIGTFGSGRKFQGSIDVSESYIKINGEYWWKGVETL